LGITNRRPEAQTYCPKVDTDKRTPQLQPIPLHSYSLKLKETIHQLRYRNGFNEGKPEHCNIYGSQDCDVSTTEEPP
jgi:hypothetical protein